MSRRIATLGGLVLLLLAAAAIVGWWQLDRAARVPGPATADVRMQIAPGTSLRRALRQLEAQGFLRDARLFEIWLRCCAPGGGPLPSVKAGQYQLVAGSAPTALLQQLVEGRVILEQVTLVEGWTFVQFRAALAAHPSIGQTLAGRGDADIMSALGAPATQSPEGRFAPETYRFAAGTPDLEILRMAWQAQSAALAAAWEARAPELPLANPDEALVLASIVEKETGLADERTLVASVFVNRLRRGMRLQSDPTVIYGIRERYDGNIRRSDLIADTPYNTYTRAGLPPTPIAMPGRDAIWATLHPATSDALYFVASGDGSGGHTFSATLEEHNRAVQRYLQRLRSQGLAR